MTTHIAQRFAPNTQSVATPEQRFDKRKPGPPLFTFSIRLPQLIAFVILVAWLPSFIIGAAAWLNRSTPIDGPLRTVKPILLAETAPQGQADKSPAVLTAPGTLEAKAGEGINFPIALDGTDSVPARSIIIIRGLPLGSALSNGFPHGESEWDLKSDEIGDLRLVLPNTSSGETRLDIQLVAPDGEVIAATETVLNVTPDPNSALVQQPLDSERIPQPAKAQALNVQDQQRFADAKPANLEQSPSGESSQTTNDDVHAEWIEPSAFVNLREGPSSSSPVISEVPKGAKLRALGRKHGWLKVTNPANSETGWIYARNIANAPKFRRSVRRAHSKVQPTSDNSIWTRVGQWFASP